MIARSNPFIAGPSVGHTSSFVGREDILRRIELELAQRLTNALVLYGQRRIGKTSVLEALARRLPERGPYYTIVFDLQDKAHESLERVLTLLAESIAERLGLPPPNFAGNAQGLFREPWLPAALATMPEDACLVLLFDEFDVLADPKAEQAARALFPYLRELLGSSLPIFMVFTLGRSIGDLSAYALSLVKGIQSYKISVLDHRDANHLLSLSEENGSLRWSPEARSMALERTHGHPYFLQQIGKELWISLASKRHHLDRSPPLVEVHHVEAVIADVLAHSQNVLEWLWDGLTPACRLVASAFAEHGPYVRSDDELQQILLKSGVKSIIRELLDAPRLLREWDLIESVGDGYRFRVELLRTWIRLNKPLRMVQDELDRLQPAAENAYSLAVYYEKSGQSSRAIELFREALTQNPNHVGAALALSDLFIAQGALDDALRQLELLHENLPSTATPRLVNVLIMRARSSGDPSDSEACYERALALSPHNSEARRGIQQIWHERGSTFERSHHLEEALHAYKKAGADDDYLRVEREIHRRYCFAQLGRLRELESNRQYAEALLLARQLSEEMPLSPPDWREHALTWAQYIEELAESQNLASELVRGHELLVSGQREEAAALFLEIVRRKASYPDAVRYLYWALEGHDPKAGPVRISGRQQAVLYLASMAVLVAILAAVLVMTPEPDKPTAVMAENVFHSGDSAVSEDLGTTEESFGESTLGASYMSATSTGPTPQAPVWEPPPELEAEVADALRGPFDERISPLIERITEFDQQTVAGKKEWAHRQIALLSARRVAWYDLAFRLSPTSASDKFRELRETSAAVLRTQKDVLVADDAVLNALSQLADGWSKRELDLPWIDDPQSPEAKADPCLFTVGAVLRALLKNDRNRAKQSSDRAEKLCRGNPVTNVLRDLVPSERRAPDTQTMIHLAVVSAREKCMSESTPGAEVETNFRPDATGSHLEVEIIGIYKGTSLGNCVTKAANARLSRFKALDPREKINAKAQTVSF